MSWDARDMLYPIRHPWVIPEEYRWLYRDVDDAFDRLAAGKLAGLQQAPGYVWQEYYDGTYWWTPEQSCDEHLLCLPDLRP